MGVYKEVQYRCIFYQCYVCIYVYIQLESSQGEAKLFLYIVFLKNERDFFFWYM